MKDNGNYLKRNIDDISKEIYDKRINFLIGSGASFGALNTLSTEYTKGDSQMSFEDIASALENDNKKDIARLMFSEKYCKDIIKPSYTMEYEDETIVLENYFKLLEYIFFLLSAKKVNDAKRCNIFTTNYDLFIEYAANKIIEEKKNCVFNDGGNGFFKRYLQSKNFNRQMVDVGVFDNFVTDIPMINLIKLHGSVSWKHTDNAICVDYSEKFPFDLPTLSKNYLDGRKTFEELLDIDVTDEDAKLLDAFWDNYKKIPIVNPTKWKFNETVLEQHYYQMLRLLSYELEKKNVYLIVFGFSFKDEHIYDLVSRSLLNPDLTVIVFCFNQTDVADMTVKFGGYKNVFLVYKHKKDNDSEVEPLTFSDFNAIISGKADKETWKVI